MNKTITKAAAIIAIAKEIAKFTEQGDIKDLKYCNYYKAYTEGIHGLVIGGNACKNLVPVDIEEGAINDLEFYDTIKCKNFGQACAIVVPFYGSANHNNIVTIVTRKTIALEIWKQLTGRSYNFVENYDFDENC